MSPALLNDVLDALRRGERERGVVEFKSNLDQQEEIGQYISALANTAALEGAERAWVVWGVADGSLAVTGSTFDPFNAKAKPAKDKAQRPDSTPNQGLIMWLQQMTLPRADFEFHALAHPQGRVVLLEIHPARSAPVAFQHVRYVRVDSHKVKLSDPSLSR